MHEGQRPRHLIGLFSWAFRSAQAIRHGLVTFASLRRQKRAGVNRGTAVAAAAAVTANFPRVFVACVLGLALSAPVTGQSVPPEEPGVLALQNGDFDKAASLFADALRQNPRNPSLQR